jgi:hypothetical protein
VGCADLIHWTRLAVLQAGRYDAGTVRPTAAYTFPMASRNGLSRGSFSFASCGEAESIKVCDTSEAKVNIRENRNRKVAEVTVRAKRAGG